MFCKKCGSEISNNVKFCTTCGAPVEIPTVAQAPLKTAEPKISKPRPPKKEISKGD